MFHRCTKHMFEYWIYSIGQHALVLYRDQTLVQQIRDTRITAWDTYYILCGKYKDPIPSQAEFLEMSKSSSIGSSRIGHDLMAITVYFTLVLPVLTTILNLFIIVTDQWLAIKHPFFHRNNITVKKTVTACVIVWLFSIFFAAFFSLFSYSQSYDNVPAILAISAIALVFETLILVTTLLMLTTSYLTARRSILASRNDTNQAAVAGKQRRLIRGLLAMNICLVVCSKFVGNILTGFHMISLTGRKN